MSDDDKEIFVPAQGGYVTDPNPEWVIGSHRIGVCVPSQMFTPFTSYENFGDSVCIHCNCGNEIWCDFEDDEERKCDCGRVYRVRFSLSVAVKDLTSGPTEGAR